jgi:predicted amidophosphoribosyltransferase
MSGPRRANYETDCDECMTYIAQDDPIYFGSDGEKLCPACAKKLGRICPQCNGQKKPEFDLCWECGRKAKGTIKVSSGL